MKCCGRSLARSPVSFVSPPPLCCLSRPCLSAYPYATEVPPPPPTPLRSARRLPPTAQTTPLLPPRPAAAEFAPSTLDTSASSGDTGKEIGAAVAAAYDEASVALTRLPVGPPACLLDGLCVCVCCACSEELSVGSRLCEKHFV